ncbi:MAG: class I SAM-dependent methyltransferase [Bryobacterales bacterium]|nr:class I SAM-dependent methyltransferase [Bryobacterales bacterium]
MDINAIGTLLGPRFEVVAGDTAKALEALALAPGARVLDVGTGSGHNAIVLAALGFDVVTGEPADDRSMYAGREWSENARKAGVRERIRFEPFDASAMPFESEAFDAVFLFGMLHHAPEERRPAVMSEALRVVKQAGAVVVCEPGAEVLKMVRVDDPGHPEAANPADYLVAEQVREQRLQGKWMEIYLFRKPGA